MLAVPLVINIRHKWSWWIGALWLWWQKKRGVGHVMVLKWRMRVAYWCSHSNLCSAYTWDLGKEKSNDFCCHKYINKNIHNISNFGGRSALLKLSFLGAWSYGYVQIFAMLSGSGRGSWSRIPAPSSRESRIPHFFHRDPESHFFFPKNTLKNANFCKS